MENRVIKKLGKTFIVNERKDLFWRNVSRNKWENNTFRILQQFVRRDSIYIDIGSWIGPTVLFAAGFAKECYAIEPDPVAFKELKENVELNLELARKIVLYNGCVSDSSGSVRFGSQTSFGDSSSSLLFSKEKESIEVSALTFKDFLDRFNISQCDVIKMDIEGGETVVLPTMKDFLEKQLPVFYMSVHQKWFVNREKGVDVILDALNKYPNFYESNGNILKKKNLKKFLMDRDVAEIVCLNKPWPTQGRYWSRLMDKIEQL